MENMSFAEMDEIEQRCLKSYWTAARKDKLATGADWPTPSSSSSYMEDGIFHLRNGSGILARFRIGANRVTRLKD
jgi:hypothetical protein